MPALARVNVWSSLKIVPRNRTTKTAVMSSKSGNSLVMVSFLILMGRMTAPIPMSSKILRILLPMTLPRSMSDLPSMSEANDTASSGALVPKATIVRPIKSFEILKCEAVDEAPSIIQSAPLMRITKPTTRSKICNAISIIIIIA